MRYAITGAVLCGLLTACSNDSSTLGPRAPGSPNKAAEQLVSLDKGEYGPTSFLKADCLAIAGAFDAAAAGFCEQLFGALNPAEPPVTHAACVEQAAALDPDRGPAFCNFIFPLVGFSSASPIIGPNYYFIAPDGTQIATHIKVPSGFFESGRKYPVVIEMSGYESGSDETATVAGDIAPILGEPFAAQIPLQGGTRASHEKFYGPEYVSITASVRGTGCSAGEFDVFSEISSYDGFHLVEWAAQQPWSNGDVGLFGHSYSGITAAHIAALAPPHLTVISISGLVGDVYRDIVYPGGLTNYGFPLQWTGGVRPAYDIAGGTLAGLLADNGDRQCLRNQAARSRTVFNEPLLHGLQDYDNAWFRDRSVVYKAGNIKVPTQILLGYQDEQTGPRGAINIFDHLSPDIPKRLVTFNGDHNSHTGPEEVVAERKAWLDYWLLDRGNPFVNPRQQRKSVRVLLEMSRKHEGDDTERSNGEIESRDFPLTQTRWTDLYLQPNGGLALTPPEAGGGHTTYFHGSKRQSYGYATTQGVNNGGELTSIHGPDEAMFSTESFTEPMVLAGPTTATLFMRAIPAEIPLGLPLPFDLELQIQLLDEGPDGALTYLQRGLLRAADQAIDPLRSQFTNEGRIYRPYRPHVGPVHELFPAGEIQELLVEIFPVGHVFRPGHKLVIKIHAPSLIDNDYTYIPKALPTFASVYHDAEHHSSLMLPVIPLAAVEHLGPDLGPCANARVRCVYPAAGGNGGDGGGPSGTPLDALLGPLAGVAP